MKLHFIAIGGKAMHNLALALVQKGYQITGSDDEIYDPSYTRLKSAGLLPEIMGWFPDKIHKNLDAVILGMHARKDNPELARAQKIGVKVFSYPEYLYSESVNKKRVVVCGSHGKTTTTAMIMHVLKVAEIDHDYMVGAQLEGYERMVQLSDADLIILEGDEYLSSPIDRRPKFLHYNPDVAIITGIAWDHINVFPTFESYVDQFRKLCNSVVPNGTILYYEKDQHVVEVIKETLREDINYYPYSRLPMNVTKQVFLNNEWQTLSLIGDHNYLNLNAANICTRILGVSEAIFASAMASFTGASRRLQKLDCKPPAIVFLDYAHAPSKVAATTKAVKQWHNNKDVVAVLELHTFSSLNKSFLPEYKGTLDQADKAVVYYDNHTIEMKKMDPIDEEEIRNSFDRPDCHVLHDKNALKDHLESIDKNAVFLFMSSGNFSGIDIQSIFDPKGKQFQ